MARRARLRTTQRALLQLLRQNSGKTVTEEQILATTKWRPHSWRVYMTNGLYSPYLAPAGTGVYLVTLDGAVTEEEFHRQITQSAIQRSPQDRLLRPLARALLGRSRDNMIFALEAYNRPSLCNRLDAFALLFCTAWEQLLKAQLVEANSESSIFRPTQAGRRRETISLGECLERKYGVQDPVRRNVERIAELRHGAAHLLMPELESPVARIFQAGVLNYAQLYRDITGTPLLPRANVGLLCLVATEQLEVAGPLEHLYGKPVAAEILEYAAALNKEIAESNDGRFALRLEVKLRFAKSTEGADIMLIKAAEAPTTAVVVEKPVDPERTHPYRTTELTERIRAQVGISFNSHDLQSVLLKEKWKASDNKYHRLQRNPDTHKYSDAAADEVVRLIRSNADYLTNARTSYKHMLRKQRARSAGGDGARPG
jgi:hypothetical protein